MNACRAEPRFILFGDTVLIKVISNALAFVTQHLFG